MSGADVVITARDAFVTEAAAGGRREIQAAFKWATFSHAAGETRAGYMCADLAGGVDAIAAGIT